MLAHAHGGAANHGPGVCLPRPLPGHARLASRAHAQEETIRGAGCEGQMRKGTRAPGPGPQRHPALGRSLKGGWGLGGRGWSCARSEPPASSPTLNSLPSRLPRWSTKHEPVWAFDPLFTRPLG